MLLVEIQINEWRQVQEGNSTVNYFNYTYWGSIGILVILQHTFCLQYQDQTLLFCLDRSNKNIYLSLQNLIVKLTNFLPQATKSVTWVCMDGSMSSPWMQFLPELLGQSSILTLANGEHMVMNQRNFKLLFETGNLNSASPACMLNCVSYVNNVLPIMAGVDKINVMYKTPYLDIHYHNYRNQLLIFGKGHLMYKLQNAHTTGMLNICLQKLGKA